MENTSEEIRFSGVGVKRDVNKLGRENKAEPGPETDAKAKIKRVGFEIIKKFKKNEGHGEGT